MVSIIMGVYNGERTLCVAIDSILNQSFEDWELIVCDDCSTDGSKEILNEYMQRDNRVKVIYNKENKGLAYSLNHCLEYVKGEFIARMDCDDISAPQRLQKQFDFLSKHPDLELVGTSMQGFDENGLKEIVKHKKHPEKYDLPKGAPFAHATIMMRTSTMKKLNGYLISNYTVRTEDVDLWYRFFAEGFHGENIDEPLYYVRLDDDAYKRRKLRYMIDASYIIWHGCDLLQLPPWYKFYCFKPILSWILPNKLKIKLRQLLMR